MTRLLGLIGLLITLVAGAWLYSRQATVMSPAGPSSNPRDTVDLIGVQNDLIAIANAERRRLATDGKYASLDDLISNQDIVLPAKHRGPYHYSAEVSDASFRIEASYEGKVPEGVPQTVAIDENMQVSRE